MLGKIEGHEHDMKRKDWHGHVSAITVAPHSRRQGFARYLMNYLEDLTAVKLGWYVDLFVKKSNDIAVGKRALQHQSHTVRPHYASLARR